MAATKIFPIHTTLGESLDYIANPEKTDNGRLVYGYMCSDDPKKAVKDFEAVRALGTGCSTVLAQHFIVSFKPGEILPERALEVGKELCSKFLNDEYQYLLAVHIDKEHTHLHVVFNNVNSLNGYTFQTLNNQGKVSQRMWKKLRDSSDEVCKRHHLSVIQKPEQSKGKSYWEWDMSRQGLSWKAKLKYAIDQIVKDSDDFEDFLRKCAVHGILVEYNPDHTIDLKFMLAEQRENNPRAKFTRSRTLGWFYETEQIKGRIAQYKGVMAYVPRTKVTVITKKENPNKFIQDAIDRNNMKLTSKAMNILSKYGVTVDDAKTASIAAFGNRFALVQELNRLSVEISELEERAETLRKYREVKPIHQEYMSLSGRKKEKYKKEHSESLAEHHALAHKILEWYPDGTTPSVEKFEKMIADLTAQRNQKHAEYKATDQKSRELSDAAREIEQYLRQEQNRDQQKKCKRNDLE